MDWSLMFFLFSILSALAAAVTVTYEKWGAAVFFCLISILGSLMAAAEKISHAIKERSL